MRILFLLIAFFALPLFGSDAKARTLYSSLDQTSISDSFAFYKLYPQTAEGKQALHRAFELMNKHRAIPLLVNQNITIPQFHIQGLISLVNKMPFDETPPLTMAQIDEIDRMTSHLPHKKLKGHSITEVDEIEPLPEAELDLARALLLYQFQDSPDKMHQIKEYEANLDMMAMQILARIPRSASNLEKIRAINHFIFHEMRFRFPPQSLSNKEIDTFTFLPSVLDSRLGVCLGVSILYLTLAQRMDLELEIFTPPGHIYLSYVDVDGNRLNIETTARGIHIPQEQYFGMNTLSLKQRTLRETIGLSFFNQASVMWHHEDYEAAVKLYRLALPFMANDPLLHLFLGINLLNIGEEKEGREHLVFVSKNPIEEILFQDTLSQDYLAGKATKEGLNAIFKDVDETRSSIFEKQKELQKALDQSPKFREGWMALAVTWLQLSRLKEARAALERYHELDPNNPTVEYYLSMVYLQRYEYAKAFSHLKNTLSLVKGLAPQAKILKPIRFHLNVLNPKYAIPTENLK